MTTEQLNLADLTEIRTIGNVREGDVLIVDAYIVPVVKATRTGKMITIKAMDLSNPPGARYFHSKHRVSTPVAKALPKGVFAYRKAVSA